MPGHIPVKPLVPGMRWLLYTAAVLVLLAGFQLFVFTGQTDTHFAWTIVNPLAAAFLGAGYWASFAIEALCAQQRFWANARIAVPSVFVFTVLTLVATLLHLDKFHLASTVPAGTRLVTWAWIAVYVLVPLLMLIVLATQARTPGVDPPRTVLLPGWVYAALAGQAVILFGFGVALFAAPGPTARLWPWQLTPLLAQATGAWLISLGVAAGQALLERDARRLRPAAVGYVLLAVLQAIAVARYPGQFRWGSAAGISYLIFLATILLTGAAGLARGPSWMGGAHPAPGRRVGSGGRALSVFPIDLRRHRPRLRVRRATIAAAGGTREPRRCRAPAHAAGTTAEPPFRQVVGGSRLVGGAQQRAGILARQHRLAWATEWARRAVPVRWARRHGQAGGRHRGGVGGQAPRGRADLGPAAAYPGAAETGPGLHRDPVGGGGRPGAGVHSAVLRQGPASPAGFVLPDHTLSWPREPPEPAGQPGPGPPALSRLAHGRCCGVQPQLVTDRPGNGHAEVELLPGPARGDRFGVLDRLLGRWPAAGHQAVPHDPVGVILIDRQQVDPAPVPDARAAAGHQAGRRLGRVWQQHVVFRLDQDRAEPVHPGRPAEVAVQPDSSRENPVRSATARKIPFWSIATAPFVAPPASILAR